MILITLVYPTFFYLIEYSLEKATQTINILLHISALNDKGTISDYIWIEGSPLQVCERSLSPI